MPRSTFAATIQPQLGARAIIAGTGSATSQPMTRSRLRPTLVGEHAGTEVRERLRDTERDDEGEDRDARLEAELLLADEGQDASLETHHRPDEGVESDEQRELRGVRAEPEPDRRHAVVSA